MGVTLAHWLLGVAGVYLGAGVLLAVPFLIIGIGRIDPGARDASLPFRLLVAPGVVALWPVVARRWIRGRGLPEATTAHDRAARGGRP